MSNDVRYSADTYKNKILREALLHAWGGTCYWCTQPVTFRQAAIDHVIPRSLDEVELEKILADLLRNDPALDEEYDLDAPTNLAPICTPCNTTKGSITYSSGRFEDAFRKVRKLAPEVTKRVRSFNSSSRVAAALAAATSTDMQDPEAIESLTAFAPLLDAHLRHLEFTREEEHFDPFEDETQQVTLKLDSGGMRISNMVEDLHGIGLGNALLGPIRATKSAINRSLASSIRADFERRGHIEPDVDSPSGRIDMEVNVLRYDRKMERFELAGSFEVEGAAQVRVTSADGSTLDTYRGESNGRGRFNVRFSADEHGAIESDGCVSLAWTSP